MVQAGVDELLAFIARRVDETGAIRSLLRDHRGLNHRQKELLRHALKHPRYPYSIEGHRRSHNVAYATARADLLDLADRGLLDREKEGRRYVFVAPKDLRGRIG